MAINTAFVLAGVAAGGTSGAELAWFAPTGATGPTTATGALDAAFLSAGLISEDGVSRDIKEDSKDVRAYGLATPVRKIVTSTDVTMKMTFLETNKVSAAVYNRLPVSGAGAITVSTGAFSTTEGTFRSQRYAMVIDAVDGTNRVRMYCSSVEVTDRDGLQVKAGEAITYGVTLTAYPDTNGIAVTTFHVVTGLT